MTTDKMRSLVCFLFNMFSTFINCCNFFSLFLICVMPSLYSSFYITQWKLESWCLSFCLWIHFGSTQNMSEEQVLPVPVWMIWNHGRIPTGESCPFNFAKSGRLKLDFFISSLLYLKRFDHSHNKVMGSLPRFFFCS